MSRSSDVFNLKFCIANMIGLKQLKKKIVTITYVTTCLDKCYYLELYCVYKVDSVFFEVDKNLEKSKITILN